ncbi:MAG: GIY-YIG nuclease family protein [Porticoccus sp.]|nr:GIY-YIG nuclease family protein [Porticoccus sp.]
MSTTPWYVYMIKASDGSLYTGITTDVDRRFQEHLSSNGGGKLGATKGATKGAKKGAKYFQGRKPEKVVYTEQGHDRSSASKREAEIKRLRREQKLALVAGQSGLIKKCIEKAEVDQDED